MRAIVPASLLGSLVFVAILYMNAMNPELLQGFADNISTNSTSDKLDEKANQRGRIARIDALLISDRNKNDIKAGRIFWGAAQHMIELAFNDKPDNAVVSVRDKVIYEFHTYTFNGVRDPIILEFQNNKLACAHYPATKTTSCNANKKSYYTSYPFDRTTQP